MIINHDHRFVFVHIPKCAGTTVRRPLEGLNQWQEAGHPWRREHPSLGLVDYAHMPLVVLREHFPEAFAAVVHYQSFALVRDPYRRFASSVSERIRWEGEGLVARLSIAELKRAVEASIAYLSRCGPSSCLPLDYIHFQHQRDYIELDGEQVVATVYPVERIHAFVQALKVCVGHSDPVAVQGESAPRRENAALMYRYEALRRAHGLVAPIMARLRRVLPVSATQGLEATLYVPRDRRARGVFDSHYVRDFVESYYASDLELYHRVAGTSKESG
ncbi:sulfotransferase family 2 domain-containing protein [Thioalkalivibrio sp. ALMg13-2]|uniref:sulfotransferase family 2 domain-containing protein n=1 Tax=Thioalkalivibrio sp. ALMg13-2 TaxID=1158167 RepID=UPI000370B290|nr:sulfotransferase family 2 domain-containing protein [Thioalkalivibrio sp. ALMg13-2]